MGTHPIFESDFDCLTECRQNWSNNFNGTNVTTHDMDRVKEYFVNVTRVVLLAKHITDDADIATGLEAELGELTRQFNEQNEKIKSSQEMTRNYLKAVVEFDAKAEALLASLVEHDKQLEINQKMEQQLAALRHTIDQAAYPTETELEAERQQSASLTSQIDQAQLKLAELKKSEKATANRDPILSLFAK